MPLMESGACCEICIAGVVMIGVAQYGHAMTMVSIVFQPIVVFAPKRRANQCGFVSVGIAVERK
jgi:hypothetical protein